MGEGRKRLGREGGQDTEAGWDWWFRVAGLPDSVPPTLCRQWGRGRGEQSVREGRRDAVPSPAWSRP